MICEKRELGGRAQSGYSSGGTLSTATLKVAGKRIVEGMKIAETAPRAMFGMRNEGLALGLIPMLTEEAKYIPPDALSQNAFMASTLLLKAPRYNRLGSAPHSRGRGGRLH